jgi:hypothetical protein
MLHILRFQDHFANPSVRPRQSDYVVGCFKLRHLEMYSIDDAGYIMFGRIGREVFAVAFLLCMRSSSLHSIKDNLQSC